MAQGIFSPRNRQKSSEDRLKELEELTKLNRGGFTAMAEDTESNIPFMLPGQRIRHPFDMNQPRLQRVAFAEPEELPAEELSTDLPPLDVPEMQQDSVSADDFLNYFTEQYFAPDASQGVASTPDGGILYPDGTIYYTDGTIRSGGTGDAQAYPVASMPDGTVRYSDDSIRSFGQPGLFGLQEGVFGQQLPVTQEYGNVNPGMGYARNVHGGVDLRTKNLAGEQRSFRLPVNAQVVEVVRAESGNPYGNSVLLQLPTGEMLRFSHLNQMGNFNPGDTLAAGQAFGSPGSTGNSTAEHLDLEYYDPSGRRADPSQFQGFPKEQQQPQQPQPQPQGQILGATNQQQPQPQQPQQQQNAYQYTPPAEVTQPKPDTPMNMDFTKIQPNPQNNPGVSAANMVDVANPTGRFDMGMTEAWRGNPEAGRLKQIESVENLGFGPEIGSSERARTQGTNVGRQFIGDALDTIVQKAKQMGVDVGERGITEKIAQGVTRFTNPQANASEPMQSVPASGEGIQQLKGGADQMMSQPARPNMSEIGSPKVVGDLAGGNMSQMSNMSLSPDSAQMQSKMPGYDARDPFFRQGLNEKFASDIDPNKAQSGALTIDLFKPTLFEDKGKVQSIFGNTNMSSEAMSKNQVFEDQKRAEEEARRAAEEAAKPQPSLNDYLGIGKNIGQWFAETGRQGDLDRLRSEHKSDDDIKSMYGDTRNESKPLFQGSSYPATAGSQPVSQSSMNNLSRLAGQVRTTTPAPAEQRGFKLDNAPVAASSATINRQAQQPQKSLFSSISSLISRLFRR